MSCEVRGGASLWRQFGEPEQGDPARIPDFGTAVTCFPVFGPIFAGKFQFSGTADSGRWTGKDDEAIEVHGGTDSLHFAAG